MAHLFANTMLITTTQHCTTNVNYIRCTLYYVAKELHEKTYDRA